MNDGFDARGALIEAIGRYRPFNRAEAAERPLLLTALEAPDIFLRSRAAGHMTASAWITDPAGERTVFVYHRIYDSWSWVGGHADGETALSDVALREAKEETGLTELQPAGGIFSLEILPVAAHERRGVYVPSHLHYNVTYRFIADPSAPLLAQPEENTGVRWFSLAEAAAASAEPWMVKNVYRKLIEKTVSGG